MKPKNQANIMQSIKKWHAWKWKYTIMHINEYQILNSKQTIVKISKHWYETPQKKFYKHEHFHTLSQENR